MLLVESISESWSKVLFLIAVSRLCCIGWRISLPWFCLLAGSGSEGNTETYPTSQIRITPINVSVSMKLTQKMSKNSSSHC